METKPTTLTEAIRYFGDQEVTHSYVAAMVWQDGPTCPDCGSHHHSFYKNRRVYRCHSCKRQFSVKVGTIFEDSPLSLDKWLTSIWMLANCKNGISSYEVHRGIGVTQKTAWFMLHRIRLAMNAGTFHKLSGTVEADETFIGGLEKNKHKDKKLNAGRGSVGKTIVAGMLERGGGIRCRVVEDTTADTLHSNIKVSVEPGSNLMTDAHGGYSGLATDYVHEVIMENFWSLLKRTVKGTYVSVDAEHLDAYCDEQAFRYNERKDDDAGRFAKTLVGVSGKRLTFKQLTGLAE